MNLEFKNLNVEVDIPMVRYKDKEYVCYLDLGIEFLRGKWKVLILCHLTHEPVRFLELSPQSRIFSH